jgi:hypothetical protein
MKRSALLILLAASLFVFSLTPVFAQSSLGEEHDGIRARLEVLREKREDFREVKQDIKSRVGLTGKVASEAAGLRQKTVSGIKVVFENILSRFDAALLRLDKIANRIASRFDKLSAGGVNTSVAQAALLNAENLGASAKKSIDKAKSNVAAIDASSTTVRDAVHTAVASVKEAKVALQAYQKSLVSALKNLKAVNNSKEGSSGAK